VHYLDLACRALLTTVFVVAVAGKIRPAAFAAFVGSLRPIRWIPQHARRPVAVATVLAEATSVALLWIPPAVPAGYLLGALTLVAFTATLAVNLRQGATLRCRCFGYDAGPVRGSHIARNLVLMAVAALGLAAAVTAGPAATAAAVAIALAAGALAGLLVTRWDDLAYVLGGS
jgi:hypothetical protein